MAYHAYHVHHDDVHRACLEVWQGNKEGAGCASCPCQSLCRAVIVHYSIGIIARAMHHGASSVQGHHSALN
eukprot:1151767-Pelagomonas_calceolata.AAC.4